MTKGLIVIFAGIFFTSCAGSKNSAHRSDKVSIEIPLQEHYSESPQDYAESWREFNEAKNTPW